MFGLKRKNTVTQANFQDAYFEQLDKTTIKFNEKDVKITNKRHKQWLADKKRQEWRNQVAEWHPNIHTPEELTYAYYIASAVGLIYDSLNANLTHIANAVYRGGFQYTFNISEFENEFSQRYNRGDSMFELVLWAYNKSDEILEDIKTWDITFADNNNLLLAQRSGKFQTENANKVIAALYNFMNCSKEQCLKMEQDFCNRKILLDLPNALKAVLHDKEAATEKIGEMIMNRVSKIGAGEQILITSDGWNKTFMNPFHVAFIWNH